MVFRGENGNEFELSLLRESFPDVQDGTGDATWATVLFRAATAEDSWEESSPCLNLFEFHGLADWLDSLAEDESGDLEASEIELLSPELRFSVSGLTPRNIVLRVNFRLRGRPEEYEVDAPTEEIDHLDLPVGRAQIKAAARELRARLRDLSEQNLKDDLTGDREPGLGIPDA